MFSEHRELRQSRVFHTCYKPCERDPPLTKCRLDALASRIHEGADVEYQVVSAFMLSPSDVAGQKIVMSSAQLIVAAHAWTLRDAVVEHCLKYFGFQPPDLKLEGNTRCAYVSLLWWTSWCHGKRFTPCIACTTGRMPRRWMWRRHPVLHSWSNTLSQSWPPRRLI